MAIAIWQVIVCGEVALDFSALEAGARYDTESGFYPGHPTVRLFWEVGLKGIQFETPLLRGGHVGDVKVWRIQYCERKWRFEKAERTE